MNLSGLEELNNFAINFASKLKSGDQVSLIGELGAGKTTLVSQIVASLGGKNVSSPSYCLQQIYETRSLQVEHWDLYRLNSLPEELYEDPSSNSIRLIEWADKFPELICNYQICINIVDEHTRHLSLKDLSQKSM